ncbi:MAG: glycosyltransferase family 2 protein [Candidatus Dormiibacterota bacterium]
MAEAVSAAILNWNGGDLVVECLRSILRQTHPIEDRIVVDNASTDGSLERLKAEDSGLTVISNARNLGFAAAANQAVAAAKGSWLLLANLDVEFEPDYVARLVAAGERDPMIGSVTGKLLRPRADGLAAIVDSTGHILYRNGWAANRGEGLEDSGQWERSEEVFGVTGAAPLYRMTMLREVVDGPAGPFDERFFAYIEDVDLDWRMRWLGWKAWYEPAVAWHHRSATGARRSPFILRHILKNRLLLVANNDLWPQGLLRVPSVAVFTVLTGVQFALESPSAPLGIIDFIRHVPASFRRRRFLRAHRRVSSRDIARWMQPFPYRQKIGRKLRLGTDRAAVGS